ncbi:uncharacterized protein DEA37_0011453 [Paragonimus westermani]|uniref:DUF4817 domain-containing protein n=1 Tax=Paragonimus westermani TaxID=34504 RepID=A0A5J4N2D2_9TREM|nr:uncharacterized protein DEA37_0011453 [Paragonimus westermani]
MSLDLETKLEIVQLYYRNGDSLTACLRAYKKKHKLHNDPFSIAAIQRVIKHFVEHKTLHSDKPTGRPSLVADRTKAVTDSLEIAQLANPHGHASSSTVALHTGIPKTSVWRIMRGIGLQPYKIKLLQALDPADYPQRLAFAQWIQGNINKLDNIIWSDEAYFSMDGIVNRHNCVIWAYENPRAIQSSSLHPEKLCVWIGFSSRHKIQPFFFPATINQNNYAAMLTDHVFPQLPRRSRTTIFQHDGAPPHYALSVRNILAEKFDENHVIGRGFGVPWPPRSPDLSPLDYYLWGTLKARVFHQFKPDNIDSMKQRIVDVWNDITLDELSRAVHNLEARVELVIQHDGGYIEQLL